MFSLRKTKLQAVSVHQSRFSSLFRATEVTGTQPQASLQHGIACKDVLSNARDHSLLSKLRTSTRFHVDRTEAFSTMSGSILLQARDPAKLNEEIQIAVDQRRCDEAWRLFEQHMQMEGFPRKSVVNNVLVCFAESLESNWLQKGYTLVEQAFDESKQNLLEKEPLVYLSLALAKSGMPVPASTILRKLVETEEYPHSWFLRLVTCFRTIELIRGRRATDEMRMAGVRTGSSVYSSLLKAYCKTNRTREVTALLRDAQKAGIQFDSSCYEALIQSQVIQNDTHGALNVFKEMKEAKIPRGGNQQFEKLLKGCEGNAEAGLMSKLLREIREGQSNLDTGVHDWNNVIHFFSKKGLMHDAEKALKRMRSLGHSPNAQTFHSMVTGYAAIGSKYTEVTELWGEMKSIAAATSSMRFDQELLDAVLYTFVRGGFFSRANEAVEMMEKEKMFVDKYKYRMLFLKYHKTAYKGKAPKVQSESQLRKRESGLAFKKWLGLT
ncbi:hypothetical protein F2Q68_00012785 [Brassica cretica]|uniref:Pentacotripeptide-repeat region of PRORP domain-containing protein n=1 Tax=Brassica cretica TaxID=69181 RepID=A0A8S9HNA4_BRACR|nr:hypothetical protein F2Q68_00012785 [Brassica cretica]